MKLIYEEDYLKCLDDNDWWEISCNGDLTDDFIIHYADYLEWSTLCNHQILNKKIIKMFPERVDWEAISRYDNLTIDFIREYKDYVDWWEISCKQKYITPEFCREFADYINWDNCFFYDTTERFIEEFKNWHDFQAPSCDTHLTEQFIDKWKFKWDWNSLCYKQKLSEKFMEENKDLIDWTVALQQQKMSIQFKKEHRKYLKK